MPHANPLRGETVLPLGPHALTLRPTFQALAQLEQATGRSLIALARTLAQGEATLADLRAIVTACATAPLPDDCDAQLAALGPLKLHEALLPFLISAITGESHDR